MKQARRPTLAQKLTVAETRLNTLRNSRTNGDWDNLVQGCTGEYLVGIHDEKKIVKAYDFTVKKDPNGFTFIQGYDGTTVPLDYIFEPETDNISKFWCDLEDGEAGERQFQMVCFLQEALEPEIRVEKGVRKARRLQQEVSHLEHPTFQLATVGGVSVQGVVKKPQALKKLVPGAYGRYYFNDSGNHACIVDYYHNGKRTILRISTIHESHQLAAQGVHEGLEMFACYIDKQKPLPENAKNCLSEETYSHLVLFRDFLIAKLEKAHAGCEKTA